MPWIIDRDLGECTFGDLAVGEIWSDRGRSFYGHRTIIMKVHDRRYALVPDDFSVLPLPGYGALDLRPEFLAFRILVRWED